MLRYSSPNWGATRANSGLRARRLPRYRCPARLRVAAGSLRFAIGFAINWWHWARMAPGTLSLCVTAVSMRIPGSANGRAPR